MHLFQPFPFDMRVDLCRRNVGMPKHRLNRPKVCTAFQQMGRKRMP